MIMSHPHPSSHPHKMSQNNNDENSKGLFIQMMRTGAYAGMGACAAAYLFHRMMMMSMPSVASDEVVRVEAARRAEREASQRAELEARLTAQYESALRAHEARLAAHSVSARAELEARVHQHMQQQSQQFSHNMDATLSLWGQQKNAELEAYVIRQIGQMDADVKASSSALMERIKASMDMFTTEMTAHFQREVDKNHSNLQDDVRSKIEAQREFVETEMVSFTEQLNAAMQHTTDNLHEEINRLFEEKRLQGDIALHAETDSKLALHVEGVEARVLELVQRYFEDLKQNFERTFHKTERLAREAWQSQIQRQMDERYASFDELSGERLQAAKKFTVSTEKKIREGFEVMINELHSKMDEKLGLIEAKYAQTDQTLREFVHTSITNSEAKNLEIAHKTVGWFEQALQGIEHRLAALEAMNST